MLRHSDEVKTMSWGRMAKAIVTDVHFLIPLAVLCLGCALLVKIY